MELEAVYADIWGDFEKDGVPFALGGSDLYKNIDGDISVFDEFSRRDYEAFRPAEQLPRTIEDSHKLCIASYRQFGPVKKMVDLIGDLVTKGMSIYHPQESVQKVCNAWWKYVNGEGVSSTFCNYLVRGGNVITVRETEKNKKNLLSKLAAYATDFDGRKEFASGFYVYLPTIDIDIVERNSSRHSANKIYALKIDYGTQKLLRKTKPNANDQFIIAGLPSFIKKENIVPRHNAVVLPPDKTRAFHHKKDTTDNWAYSIIHSMLEDLMLLRKLKLADVNVVDGLISHIVHCKVGSLDHKIIPNKNVLNEYNNMMLTCLSNGRPIRIATGPEVEFDILVPDTSKFLGEDKYKPILASIYATFGLPPSLTGQTATTGTLAGNALNMDVFIQCLEDIRRELMRFWYREFKLFQRAMGFQKPPKLVFQHPNFQDKHAIMALMVQLVDRKIVSADRVREVFGFDLDIEKERLSSEYSMEEDRRHVSALSDAQPMHAYKKIALQAGQITPGEVGVKVDRENRNPGEKNAYEVEREKMREQQKINEQKQSGVPGQGRPPGSKDKTKRKTREVKS